MMKKVGKTIALVIDLVFMPIRIIVAIEIALTGTVICDDISILKAYTLNGIAGAIRAFSNVKPILKSIWND